jgi:hypothetical protein
MHVRAPEELDVENVSMSAQTMSKSRVPCILELSEWNTIDSFIFTNWNLLAHHQEL